MTENFLKLVLDTKPEIQEAQRIPRTINAKKKTTKKLYPSISFQTIEN